MLRYAHNFKNKGGEIDINRVFVFPKGSEIDGPGRAKLIHTRAGNANRIDAHRAFIKVESGW